MARPGTTRTTAVLTAVLAAGTLAACSGSSSGGGSPSTPPPVTATVTRSAAAPAPRTSTSSHTTSAPTTSPGTAGDASYCKESQLRASIETKAIPGDGRHGERVRIVDFTNTSDSTCVLYGYPGAAVLDSSGKQVKQAKRTIRGRLLGYAVGHDTLVHVSLEPGAVASAGIEGVDQQEQGAAQAGCDADPYPQIEITPPNTSTPVPFDVPWPICYSFTVHPVNYKN